MPLGIISSDRPLTEVECQNIKRRWYEHHVTISGDINIVVLSDGCHDITFKKCAYCGQFGEPCTECIHCGAPIGGACD